MENPPKIAAPFTAAAETLKPKEHPNKNLITIHIPSVSLIPSLNPSLIRKTLKTPNSPSILNDPMDSKDETSHPIPSGSISSPAPDNSTLINKTIALNDNHDETSVNGSKGGGLVSEDEGYVSGEEEFEEAVGEGNSGFADAPEKVESLPVSAAVANEDDGEKGDKGGVEGAESEGDKLGGVVEGVGGKDEIPDSGGELGANSDADANVREVVEVKEEETEKKDGEVGSLSNEKSEAVDASDMKITTEGDSVVDAIKVDVDVAEPGVAVVGEAVESGEDKLDEKETVVEQENSELVVGDGDDIGLPEGDYVVDSIQADVTGPGVVVVGEKEENGEVESEPVEEEVAAEAVVEQEKSEVVEPDDVGLTPEEDSVVDSIQVDKVGPGVVVGEMDENGDGKIEGVDVPLVSVREDTKSGDVVEEEVSSRVVVLDNQISETPAESGGDVVEPKPVKPEVSVVGDEKDEKLDTGAVVDVVNGVDKSITGNVSVDGTLEVGNNVKEPEVQREPAVVPEATENGTTKIYRDGEFEVVDETSNTGTVLNNDERTGLDPQEIREVEDEMDEENPEDSDGDTDGMIFGSSEAAKKFIEDLERESGMDSNTGADSSLEQSRGIDGQIVTDSEEEGDTDDEGNGKELFDSAALTALLKAATGADSDGGNITITSQDGSRLFSLERPAGLGSSLRSLRPVPMPNRPNIFSPSAPVGEVEENLSEEEKKKLEKLQQIKVKFLRLVHRLGLSPEDSVAAQVLYRLALLGGRQGLQSFSLDAAKRMASELEAQENDDLGFSINILALGKSGVGKSATINSLFGEEKAHIGAFETGTASAVEISGLVDGVKVRVVDTPGLKSSAMEQGFNRNVLSSVKKLTKKSPTDVVLYVDRLDAQTRDHNDLPLLKTVTSALSPSIWRSAIVTLTHAASAPPEGPSGAPLSYEVFVSQRSHVVQQSIGHAVGDHRMMSPSLMNPVSLVENHPSCRENLEGQKILPNGQIWRPQLLLLCYSMKILSEASALSKPQDPFDHGKLFGFRARSPPLPYMLSSMLQSRPHPKLPSDQGGENGDSDIDLDDLSDSDQEEEDEYDQLPPFKPLRKAQIAKLSKEQKKAYFEEYDYRVKLLQKKQWREELRRMKEIKKRGKDVVAGPEYDEDGDPGAAAPVAVPLPDMALPPSFDGDNPAYRYRFLEPTSQFLARPVLDSHGWDHDCGYDGVNLEHTLAIASRFPAAYTIQVTKDKKDFTLSLDSSIAAKLGENMSTMAGFDIQSMGKQLAYIVRGDAKLKNLKKHKAAGGVSFTFLGENVVPGVKVEDQIMLGKQYVLVGSAGAVKSQHDTAYGANFELQRRESDYPIGQVQSTFSMSIIKWRGDLALGFNSLAQFSLGRNSKVAVRAGINNKLSGQVTVRTSSSEHLSLALAAIIPTALSIYKKFWPGASGENYSIY